MAKEGPLTTIKILTLMQLGDKMDITLLTDKKRLILSILWRIIFIAGATAAIYFVMQFIQSILQIPITSHLLMFVLMLMQVMGIITGTFGLLKTLYQSRDNALLLSYPAKHTDVFLSKIIVSYFTEFLRNLTFLFPFLLSFGLFNSYGIHWTYYLNTVIFTFILPLITVLISALISLPVMFVSDFLKGQAIISGILTIGFFALVFYGIISFLQSLPANLELVAYYKRMLTVIARFFEEAGKYGLYLICVRKILSVSAQTILKEFLINYSILIGVIVVLAVMVVLLTMPFYFKIASKAVEVAKSKRATKMKVSKSIFAVFFKKELKMTMRNSDVMINNFIYLLLMPFLLFIINKIFSLVNTNVIGDKILVIVNIALGLTMVMVSNIGSATALSSEGSEFYLLKTAPSKTKQIAWAKITVNLVFSTLAIIASTICIHLMSKISVKEIIFIFYLFMTVNTSHILLSFEFDLLNPQVKDYIATGTIQNNKNVSKSMALGVALAFLFAALFGLFIFFESNEAWIKVLLIATGLLVTRLYLFVTKLNLYFDDIEM